MGSMSGSVWYKRWCSFRVGLLVGAGQVVVVVGMRREREKGDGEEEERRIVARSHKQHRLPEHKHARTGTEGFAIDICYSLSN